MSRLNPFPKGVCLTDTNINLLSMGEAVARWQSDGQFLMTEVNHTDAYEGNDCNLPGDAIHSQTISKIDAVLGGMDFVKDVKAVETPTPAPEPAPAPVPSE